MHLRASGRFKIRGTVTVVFAGLVAWFGAGGASGQAVLSPESEEGRTRPASDQQEPTTLYQVRITPSDASRPPEVQIFVRFPAGTREITFSGPSVGIEPAEWHEEWVSAFKIADPTGQLVQGRESEPGRWLLESDHPDGVTVSYSVNLDLALTSWPAGNEHAAYWEAGGLYAVGEALFATGDVGGTSRVEFSVPAGWTVSTPWQRAGTAKPTFLVSSYEDLLDNAVVLGRYVAISHRARGFRYELALIGRAAGVEEQATRLSGAVLDAYVTMFGGVPEGAYLQAMFVSDAEDGEAFKSSSGFRTSVVPDQRNVILWGNQLAHELFHRWMASDAPISPASYDDSQWLSEGAAEYYANLTLLRAGVIGVGEWLRKLEKHLGLYLYYRASPAFDASLRAAGGSKWRERLAVYNGGWAASFCLDVWARERNEGRVGLDAFMNGLWEQFGATETSYHFTDLPRVFEASTGVSANSTFDRFIAGTETLPVTECLSAAGLKAGIKGYAAEIWAWPLEAPSPEQRAVWQALSRHFQPGAG